MVKISTLAIWLIILFSARTFPVFAGSAPISADTTAPKLLYVVEGTQSYLIPYIERKLKNLRRPDSDILLYDSVASLNTLTVIASIQATLIDALSEAYTGNISPQFKVQRDSARKFSNFLQNYQSVLAIKVAPLQDLVEYQFTLYDIINEGFNIRYRNSSSIFIDPRSSHYQADLTRGLDQVFELANKKPRVNLTANKNRIDQTYYLTVGDTLLLQPIIDDESVEGDRIYFWTQLIKDTIKVPIEPSRKDQFLKNLQPGKYTLFFNVSNGINYSITDTIILHVYTRPLLTITRPHDESFFRKFQDRLIIQEYVFITRQIDYFSDYSAGLDAKLFTNPPPKLFVTVSDKNGAIYASKSFPFTHPAADTAKFTGKELIGSLDTMLTQIKTVKDNKYIISFVARNPAMTSKEIRHDLNVYQRLPFCLLYDVMIFPVEKNGLFHSWINAGIGLDLRLNKWLSGIIIFGTDLAQASFQHFYTDLVANFGPIRSWPRPFNKLEGGPALLINHDNGNESTGFKLSYNFHSGSHTNLKIGGSFYNLDHVNYYAIRFTGDIFLNH